MSPPPKTFADLRREARATAATRVSRRELARLALFKDAHQETIVPLLRNCPVRQLATGEILLRAGEACPAVYLVLSGRLQLRDRTSTVPDVFVNPGDSVGELFLLQADAVRWTISAFAPTRVLVVDRKAAWVLINASHEIARNWLALLAARLRVGGTLEASAELKTSYKRHATLDESTGLHNRLWLESTLPRVLARSAMNHTPIGLLLVEIDDFAQYIAQWGPDAGDHARYAVAQTLINSVRPTDLIACYGEAAFAIVLPDANVLAACRVGERVRHAVSEAVVMMSDESILPSVSVSVGAIQLRPTADVSVLLASAENAVQTAKQSGGNRVGMGNI